MSFVRSTPHARKAASGCVRREGDDPHADGGGKPRRRLADAAEADDPAGQSLQFHQAGAEFEPEIAGPHRRVGADDVPRQSEHQGNGLLGHGADVGERRVDDRYAGLCGEGDVDLVAAGAVDADHAQQRGLGDRLGGKMGAADDRRGAIGELVPDRRRVRRRRRPHADAGRLQQGGPDGMHRLDDQAGRHCLVLRQQLHKNATCIPLVYQAG